MDSFKYRNGKLFCEDVDVEEIGKQYGTPCYIYSTQTFIDHYQKINQAFSSSNLECTVCYSVKANSHISIIKMLANEGSGFDVVSGGEIHRVLKAGGDPSRIVFAGVGKTDEEIRYALRQDIMLFNVESEQELIAINTIAGEEKKKASIAIRVNPDVDPDTHVYITTGKSENKFGLDFVQAKRIMKNAHDMKHIVIKGIHAHIGSQITSAGPYVESLTKLVDFLPECLEAGHHIEYLNIGGGFGIHYNDKKARPAREIADQLMPILQKTNCHLLLEPGRFIAGNSGILLTRVLYVKESGKKKFTICDAGMTDLLRPSLYRAYHRVWPTSTDPSYNGDAPDENEWKGDMTPTDIVGPICESGDYFTQNRPLPSVQRNDYISVFSAGAYGACMSSNYNSHPKACEILINGSHAELITSRQTYDELIANEKLVSF